MFKCDSVLKEMFCFVFFKEPYLRVPYVAGLRSIIPKIKSNNSMYIFQPVAQENKVKE